MPETEAPRATFKQFAQDNALMQLIDRNTESGQTKYESLRMLLQQASEQTNEGFSIVVTKISNIIAPLVENLAGKSVGIGYLTANARELIEDYARFTDDKELTAKVQAARQNLAPQATATTPATVVEIGAGR